MVDDSLSVDVNVDTDALSYRLRGITNEIGDAVRYSGADDVTVGIEDNQITVTLQYDVDWDELIEITPQHDSA